MPIYKYENIEVSVDTIDPRWVDVTGETVITLPSELVSELVENSCNFFEFFVQFDIEELYRELEEDIDKIVGYFKNLEQDVEIRSTDAIIAIYEYALDNQHRQFKFDVQTENISWVIHDILHAIHDASGCTIYVAADIEKDRILKSLEITQEQFPNHMPDFHFLENLESEFYDRFEQGLCLDEFKYLEETW